MAEEASAEAGTAGTQDGGQQQTNQNTGGESQGGQQQATHWSDGLGDELKGWAQNRGYTNLKADEALPKIAEGFWNAEKKMGVPADRVLKLPEDMTDPEALAPVYDRLGRPESPDKYELAAPEGVQTEEAFVNWARNAFYKAGLTQAQAKAVFEDYMGFENEYFSNVETNSAEESQAQELALKKEWGNAFQQNTAIAGAAANQLGVTTEEVDAIQEALGFDRTMKLFHQIGSRTMEPNLLNGGQNNDGMGSAMTPEAAKQRIEELKADPDWRKAFNNNGPNSKEARQWNWLHQMAYPDDGSAQVVRI